MAAEAGGNKRQRSMLTSSW